VPQNRNFSSGFDLLLVVLASTFGSYAVGTHGLYRLPVLLPFFSQLFTIFAITALWRPDLYFL
jgi:hypothetical protein